MTFCGPILIGNIWSGQSKVLPDGSGVLAQSSDVTSAPKSGLGLRILSALVMAPVAIAAVWFGSPWFGLLILVFSIAMIWEWMRMCAPDRALLLAGISGLGLAISMYMQSVAPTLAGLLPALIAAIITVLACGRERALVLTGAVFIPVAALAVQWLRAWHADGLLLIMWLFLTVWATDTGAYAFGRAIGGPKLAPRFSPKKTWAGLFGGMICAALIGGLMVYFSGGSSIAAIALTSAALAVVAQIGDLAESALKRRFGVKDSSNLIPGHGGFLDRADGMLSVLPVAFVIVYFFGLTLH
ncbi:phosphatidate cytidylyltransferase [Thalassospira marina]|uniref:Phosphatidate cytidylyltransferase n=1 Tax=Thalassospira marina TaxID=2048283 RepID=A0ABM6Q916_9PROT|nr:phosphatidate cytidylyltransferase [Thalassospira marina]